MGKSKSPASRAKANRDKGRLGEFLARLITALNLLIPPSCLNLRAKSSPGCDLWPASPMAKKFPFAVEVKCRGRLNFFQTMAQAKSNQQDGLHPLILAFHGSGDIAAVPMDLFYAMVYLLNEANPEWAHSLPVLFDRYNDKLPKGPQVKFNVPDSIIYRGQPYADDTTGN